MLSRALLVCLTLACLTLLGSCSSVNSTLGGNTDKEALSAIEWSFGKAGIRIDLQADPRLNIFDGNAHTLVLGVAQFTEPNQFAALLGDSAAIGRLLEGGKLTPGMLALDRFVVEPGRSRSLMLDRAQQAQYVGLIAGYFELAPLQNTSLFRVPFDIAVTGRVISTRTATPAPLRIRLVLGSQRIAAAESLTAKGELLARPAPSAPPPADGKAPPKKEPPGAPLKVDLNTVRQAVDAANSARKLSQ